MGVAADDPLENSPSVIGVMGVLPPTKGVPDVTPRALDEVHNLSGSSHSFSFNPIPPRVGVCDKREGVRGIRELLELWSVLTLLAVVS